MCEQSQTKDRRQGNGNNKRGGVPDVGTLRGSTVVRSRGRRRVPHEDGDEPHGTEGEKDRSGTSRKSQQRRLFRRTGGASIPQHPGTEIQGSQDR